MQTVHQTVNLQSIHEFPGILNALKMMKNLEIAVKG